MKFHVILRRDLENARSPFRVVQHNGCEVEWVNVLLDQQRIRGVAETTLRSYAYDLLHFLRWWAKVKHSTAATDKALTESTLLDYIRFQTNFLNSTGDELRYRIVPNLNQQPPPAAASINRRVGIAERALQLAFPQVQTPFVRGFQSGYWRPLPLGTGSPRPALSRLRVRTPKRVIVPLSDGEVAQFWASFRTTRFGDRRPDAAGRTARLRSARPQPGGSAAFRIADARAG